MQLQIRHIGRLYRDLYNFNQIYGEDRLIQKWTIRLKRDGLT
jgi:hypothetical protein